MIIPSVAVSRAREELGVRLGSGEIAEDRVLEQVVALDPCDYLALMGVGKARQDAGDLAAAEQLYWRALEASPCSHEPYIALSHLLMERDEHSVLAISLFELGIRKILANDQVFEEFRSTKTEWSKEFPGEPDFTDKESLEEFVAAMAAQRAVEPRKVTDRLRPYRLIHELQVSPPDGAAHELVDRIVEEGESCWPLLVGVLRGWYNDQLPDGVDGPAIASLALLGEIGNPAALPALVEFCAIEDEALGNAANWAVERIAFRHAAEAIKAFRALATGADAVDRCSIARHLLTMPEASGKGEVLVALLENFEGIPKEHRDSLFLTAALCLLATKEPQGPEMLGAALERCSTLLKRKTRTACQQLLQMHASQPLPAPPVSHAPAASVYDLCCGEEEDENEEEDAEEEEETGESEDFQQPVQAAPKPGRNAPCWCGSGRKYKKCHLAADENAQKVDENPARTDDAPEALRRRISSFMDRAVKTGDFGKVLSMFFGKVPANFAPSTQDEEAFNDWLVHDYVLPGTGRTVIEEFLRKNESTLSDREREMASQWGKSRYTLVEVREVKRGVGLELSDLLLGETFFVYDKNTSNRAAPSDCLLVRVEEFDNRKALTGAVLHVARHASQPLRDWILADKKKSWFSWPQYLRNNSHRIRQKALELGGSG
jgi:hypothetical protein